MFEDTFPLGAARINMLTYYGYRNNEYYNMLRLIADPDLTVQTEFSLYFRFSCFFLS